MQIDKVKLYLIDLLMILILFFTLFASIIINKYFIAIFLLIVMIILKNNYRVKYKVNVYDKQVTILMILLGVGYVIINYISGLYFGFTTSKVLLSIWSIFRFIIPLSIIIISSEYIRKILLSQEIRLVINGNKFNIHYILVYIITVLINLIIYKGIYDLSSLDDFLKMLGLCIFASFSSNYLYQHVSFNFNEKAVIIYRLIITLFMYIIPIFPDMPLLVDAFYRTVYPFIVYSLLDFLYIRNNRAVKWKNKKKQSVITIIFILILLQLVMLISCRFKYGIIVIGTDSMTGTINRGDAIIFEKYDGSDIKVGEIIMFNNNNLKTIHRVVKILEANGEVRYYTKGDSNKEYDNGYRLKDDIIGVIRLKVKYIGRPTLFVHQMFKK